MAYINLNPTQSVLTAPQTIVASQDARVRNVVFTTDGSAPTLARNLAYDTLTPSNPFISVVQDGKGNALFDGGFPKWYNGSFLPEYTTYENMSATYKYFVNALKFIAKPGKGNKILFLGDAEQNTDGSYRSYHIKDEIAGPGFKKSIDGACLVAGYVPTYLTPDDFGTKSVDISYSYLDQFCAVVFFSTAYTGESIAISPGTLSNLVAFREAGHGIFIVTDHGTDDGTEGFFYNANLLARQLGAEFRGNYDRTPVNVGYLIDTYGDHILWSGMSREESVHAGYSESRVVITERQRYAIAPNVNIADNGWTIIRYLIELDDGSISLENYTYGLGTGEFVSFSSAPPTVLNSEPLNFQVGFPSGILDDEIRGIIKHSGSVRGEFVRTPAAYTGNWLTPDGGKVFPRQGDLVEVVVTAPFSYFKSSVVGRVQPAATSLSMARLTKSARVHELTTHKVNDLVKDFHVTLGTKAWIGTGKKIKSLRDYLQN